MTEQSIGFTAKEARDMILGRLEHIAASMSELHDDFLKTKNETNGQLGELSHRIAMHEAVPAHASTVMTLGEHKLRMDQMDHNCFEELKKLNEKLAQYAALAQQTETREETRHDLARFLVTTGIAVMGMLFTAGAFWLALVMGLIKGPGPH